MSLQKSQDNYTTHFDLGNQLKQQGKLNKAVLCYRKTIELNPGFSMAHHHLGTTLASLGKIHQAIRSYRRAIKLNPNFSWSYHHLGIALQQQGNFAEAVTCYRQAIELNPKSEAAYKRLQYIPIPKSQIEPLISCYRQVTATHPDLAIAWGNLGDILTMQGKIDEAISCYQTACYQEAITSNPELAKANWKSKKELAPDFIIIGSAKCGTTSLYSYIVNHPQVFHSHKKELNFFDKNFDKGVDWYLAHFPAITDEPNFLTGEASPGYLNSFRVAQRMHKLFPQIKLIIMLRNPVDRAISQYYHKVRLGEENRSLEEVINYEIEGFQAKPKTKGKSRYMLGQFYVELVKKWMDIFPRKQFLIIKTEQLESNTATVMKQVFDFLGLPEHQTPTYPKLNAGSYSSINKDLRLTLTEYFCPHNQRLEEYLGIEFNWE